MGQRVYTPASRLEHLPHYLLTSPSSSPFQLKWTQPGRPRAAGSTAQAASIPERQPCRPLSWGVNLSCCVGSFVLKFRRIFVTIAELTLRCVSGVMLVWCIPALPAWRDAETFSMEPHPTFMPDQTKRGASIFSEGRGQANGQTDLVSSGCLEFLGRCSLGVGSSTVTVVRLLIRRKEV